MIGIYKITNKNTGKSYIGQSNDIERRFKEHQVAGKKSRIPVDIAIQNMEKIYLHMKSLKNVLLIN